MKRIAIITARGGSKRIPKKNIKEFCGKPIIAYSIDAAIRSDVFDTVMVSTDSQEIAEVAENCGAEVPFFRSEETSDDYATTADVLLEVLETYKNRGEMYDVMACIYPTAPFVTEKKFKEAMALFEASSADSLIPVIPFSYPPQRGFIIEENTLRYNRPEYSDRRSQDLDTLYHDCGQFYICKVNEFLKHRNLVMPNTCPMVISEMETQDIDNLTDWKMAELKYRMMIENEKH